MRTINRRKISMGKIDLSINKTGLEHNIQKAK